MLLDRQWKLTIRDSALVRGRIIQARACLVTMALIINLMSVPSCLQWRCIQPYSCNGQVWLLHTPQAAARNDDGEACILL